MSAATNDPRVKPQDKMPKEFAESQAAETDAAESIDDSEYRERTKEEILDGIERGFRNVLAGNYRPIEELFDEPEQ